jgi:hypothetical protein
MLRRMLQSGGNLAMPAAKLRASARITALISGILPIRRGAT